MSVYVKKTNRRPWQNGMSPVSVTCESKFCVDRILGKSVPVPVLTEVEAFLFGQRLLERSRLSNQTGLSLFANPTAKDRLDEDQSMTIDKPLDLVLASVRPENLGRRKVDVPKQARTMKQTVKVHEPIPSRFVVIVVFLGCLPVSRLS